jgi:hypothetical protein
MNQMHFEAPPKANWLGVLLSRKSGLGEGENLPRFSAKIEGLGAEQVDAYRANCGFPDSPFLPLPLPQVVAAPLHVAIFTHKNFPLPAMGLIHVSSRIVQHQPIPVMSAMDVHCWIEGQRQARKGIEADLITEVSIAGERVWESVTTVLSLAGSGHGQKTQHDEPTAFVPSRSTVLSLPTDLGRRYGRIAGDRNPIHLYPWSAKLFGFKRHIIHGMWSLARSVAELSDDLEPGPVQLDVRFKRPIFLPGRVVFSSGVSGNGQGFCLSRPDNAKVHLFGWIGRPSDLVNTAQ